MTNPTRPDKKTANSQQKRLSLVLVLNLLMISGLIIVGLSSHSVGVLAAGGDYIADSMAILLGIMAIRISLHPHGHPKATTYVALINGSFLLVVSALVMVEAVRRLLNGAPEVNGLPVLIISTIATVVMGLGVLILGKSAGSEDLHMRSVLLDTISDAVSSAAVAVTGAIIFLTGRWYWLDPAMAVIISLIIGVGAIKLLRDVYRALRGSQPITLDVK